MRRATELLAPVLLHLRRQRQGDRRGVGHLELRRALPATDDLALQRWARKRDSTGALGAGGGQGRVGSRTHFRTPFLCYRINRDMDKNTAGPPNARQARSVFSSHMVY